MKNDLFDNHRRELLDESGIAEDVVAERGYRSMSRPTNTHNEPREELKAKGIPTWATAEDYYFPGLLIPLWDATGHLVSYQWKPKAPVVNRDGKKMKYASAKGRPSVLDVHPRWTRDRGTVDPALLPFINDIAVPLYITEGVKKADSLTSRGCVTIGLNGVYNWRAHHGTLGDWEDVPLKGRSVRIVFDSDAWEKPNVLRAMQRLGRWLKSKQAAEVVYIIPPTTFNGRDTKGVDDFFAAGGTLEILAQQHASKKQPVVDNTDDFFTDARMAGTVADEVMYDRYAWNPALGWLAFTGAKWEDVSDAAIAEDVRLWTLDQFAEALKKLRDAGDRGAAEEQVDGWRSMLSGHRIRTMVVMARGAVEIKHELFDADLEAINTKSGMLALSDGHLTPTGPADYTTKITGAAFEPDAQSDLWDAFIERILPDQEVRAFVQRLLGYSMLGVVREHVMPIFTGDGANGKGTLRDTIMAAFGDYATEVDPELLMAQNNARHLTFLMELRGRRIVFCSETDKRRNFAEAQMKRLVGGDPIQANRMHKDPITFMPSHTLVMCTNHLPIVSGDDPAVWRRIVVVPFDIVIPEGERDGRLPEKLAEPHVLAAVLAWCHRGYLDYTTRGLDPPDAVKVRTAAYRAESDAVGRFTAEAVEFGRACSCTAAELYDAYTKWCLSEGEEATYKKREFGQEMARRNFKSQKIGGVMIYRGLMPVKIEQDGPQGTRYGF